MKRIKLSQIDRLEVENALLRMNMMKQGLDNLIEKKAILQGITNFSEWTFDLTAFEFVEMEKPKED